MSWRIAGRYFESCNCDPICPCRRINGVPGGRSTFSECLGVLTWQIDAGHAGEVTLDGLAVALATRYHDDEPGSPWSHFVYIADTASAEQHAALADIYTGRSGGDALLHFPWAWKESRLLGVRSVPISVSHEPRRQWLRIRELVTVSIEGAWAGQETVTCVIPGHERGGEELVAGALHVADDELQFSYTGNCGYAAGFDYSG